MPPAGTAHSCGFCPAQRATVPPGGVKPRLGRQLHPPTPGGLYLALASLAAAQRTPGRAWSLPSSNQQGGRVLLPPRPTMVPTPESLFQGSGKAPGQHRPLWGKGGCRGEGLFDPYQHGEKCGLGLAVSVSGAKVSQFSPSVFLVLC